MSVRFEPGGRRQALGRGPEQRQVGRRIAPDDGHGHAASVRESDLQLLIPANHVIGRDDEPISRPDDAGCVKPPPAFDPDHALAEGLHGRRERLGQFS